ncbi:MAG: hypothetical protein QOF51_3457 [Chloroflexota bacterium]|nr:hypothetical protein [Chloroflexota bacterium]
MAARRVEIGSGLLAALLGVGGWLWAVFGPTYVAGTYATGPDTPDLTLTSPGSLAQVHDLGSGPIVYLIALLVCVVAIGIGAALHGARRVPTGLPILWTATAFLVAGVFLSIYTVGPFIGPAAVLAVLASVAGGRADGAARAQRT